jgi:DNA-binding NarL/FixJ family response regulator
MSEQMQYETEQTSSPSTIRIAVAVGTHLACDAYSARLGIEEDFALIPVPGPATAVGRALSSLALQIVVVDPQAIKDPDLAIVRQIHAMPSHPRVVALVAPGDRALATQLVREGVSAAVLKSAAGDELVAAIRWASRGSGWISPQLLRGVLQELHEGPKGTDDRLNRLTAREREVFQLMVDGLGRKQMAERLYLSVDTVRTHTRTIMEKLDVHSATAAVAVALSAGLRPRP